MALWKKLIYSLSPKKEIRSSNEEDQQEIRNFHSPKLPDTKKKLAPTKKKHLLVLSRGRGREYTMENKDTNTNYQKVDGVGTEEEKL